ncbi:MAG TPA: fibronectin type III-like domain-contianing protein, partial [Paludibacter sp.]|nr:fibronectin type III-like domain-contianing protein [Paludibacter sp.]
LVQTWPRSIDDLPPMMDYDIRHGRTYMYSRKMPLYPFGFGLSYTSFDYSNLRVDKNWVDKSGKISVSLDITNTGGRDGEEVVQIYVTGNDGIQRLKGFTRVMVTKGETKNVRIEIKGEDLASWDTDSNSFKTNPGQVELQVGASSADIRLKTKVQLK